MDRTSSVAPSALADHLEAEAERIAGEWHAALQSRLRLRPQKVFPGERLLDGMPGVVRWIAEWLRDGEALDPTTEDSLHELAQYWRDGGYSVEEALLHLRLLADVVHRSLERHLIARERAYTPASAASASAGVGRALDRVRATLVASYRDAEEERFADFGSMLAHEIRDDLGVALGAVEMIDATERGEMELDGERRRELLGSAQSALEHANHMVKSVRALSRTGGPAPRSWRRAPLDVIVDYVVGEVGEQADDDVRLEIFDELPSTPVPEEPVSLILHNLLENAVKYRDPEKAGHWVRIHSRTADDGTIRVSISDNGLGISESERERIFARFRRGQRARGPGFGLGLAIVRQAARQIDGTLMLDSEPGEGSTFGFTIPPAHQG